jgi:hypothetical protein
MQESGEAIVKVGKFDAPLSSAVEWVRRYTDAGANRTSAEPYAYPAYDLYDAARNDASFLEDGDLLAPVLLSVQVSIRSFYALQRHREQLQASLRSDDLALPLADLADGRIRELIGDLYSVLDRPDCDLWGVGGTTLSKVLHRKRPSSIPLHDRWVRACYLGDAAPVPFAKSRSWADYMALVSVAMATDLRGQSALFSILQSASRASPALSDLRLLDILAWNLGQRAGDHDDPGSTILE